MSAFVFDRIKGAIDIEERDIDSIQHDTGGLSGRKFFHTNGFHLHILGWSDR
jgi:hypothetical protein